MPTLIRRFVAPVAMPKQGQEWESGTAAVCSGWGSTEFNGPAPDELQRLDMGVLSDAECQDLFDADSTTDYPTVRREEYILNIRYCDSVPKDIFLQ